MAREEKDTSYPSLISGMSVVGDDGGSIGSVREVFRGIGEIESFGAVGIPPQQEGHDPVQYAYSEGMPGSGDDYFTVESAKGGTLYVPFSAIGRVADGQAVLAVDADAVPMMGWDVRPDALKSIANEYEDDAGAKSNVA